ncbi:DUF3592 domain-containing protein [Myxococcaceae bacterium JPH2]|nr:DUF3592 domain-containing protein [Myxococcaceae bacterium JPH2]
MLFCSWGLFAFLGWFILSRSIRARQRDEQIRQTGEPAEATVLQVQRTQLRIHGTPVFAVTLEVRRAGHAPFEVRLEDRLDAWDVPAMEAGRRVKVRLDPSEPQKVFIVGADPVQAVSAPAHGDPVKALADLQRMANDGLITSEEFARKREEILARL